MWAPPFALAEVAADVPSKLVPKSAVETPVPLKLVSSSPPDVIAWD